MADAGQGNLTIEDRGGYEVMLWSYGEFLSTAKWQTNPTARAQLATVVHQYWESTARDAGYVPNPETTIETVAPMWPLPVTGVLDDQTVDGVEPEAFMLTVTGEVTFPDPAVDTSASTGTDGLEVVIDASGVIQEVTGDAAAMGEVIQPVTTALPDLTTSPDGTTTP
jgi:hypothetical protein